MLDTEEFAFLTLRRALRLPRGLFVYTPLLCWAVATVVSDSVRPQGLWPARLLCPWDSPGKSTGVGC